MNTDTAVYLTFVIAFIFGWLPTVIIYRRKFVALKKSHKDDLHNEFRRSFDAGWEAALQNRIAVKKAHLYFFGTK